MRCPECRTTGYTADELAAHIKEQGHTFPEDPESRKDWLSKKEFPEAASAPRKIPREDLIAALRELGVSVDQLKPGPATASAPAAKAEAPAVDTAAFAEDG